MAATVATVNVVAASSAVGVASTPVTRSAPTSCRLGFSARIGGQRLAFAQNRSVAVRGPVQIRAEESLGKKLQSAGDDLSAKVQETAETVKDSLGGAQVDAKGSVESAARTGQKKVEQGAGDAEGIGSDLKNQLFGAGKEAQKDVEKNVSKATGSSKDLQSDAQGTLKDLQKQASDAVDNVQDSIKKATGQ